MNIAQPDDFMSGVELTETLTQTTHRIQRSCSEMRQELDGLARRDALNPGEHHELNQRIEALLASATMVLRCRGGDKS